MQVRDERKPVGQTFTFSQLMPGWVVESVAEQTLFIVAQEPDEGVKRLLTPTGQLVPINPFTTERFRRLPAALVLEDRT